MVKIQKLQMAVIARVQDIFIHLRQHLEPIAACLVAHCLDPASVPVRAAVVR